MPQLIYIIEDQKNIRELLLFTMESHGYNAMAFELAEDALSEIRTRMPDLIICDIMPVSYTHLNSSLMRRPTI